ncbi:hypothetical protein VA249_41570 [Vibrio alfacsensis]|nr:hypothetical protein VA249_41570 [Vibrio alfacsensis]
MWEFLELILEMKEKVCSKAVRNALIAGLVMAPVAGNASVIGDTWEAFTKNDKITIGLCCVIPFRAEQPYLD